MKTNTFLSRSFLVFCLLISVSVARAQYVPLPDSVFGNWLNNHGYTQCLTGNGTTGYQLDTTCGAVITATSIDLSAISVFDLTGIRYFRSLTDLNCSMSHLTTMAPLPPNLQRLDCSTNSLTSLGTLPARLTYLDCGNNRMTSMILPPRLDTLWCNNNLLDSLPTLTDSLKVLFCFSNRITSISSLPATLTGLACFSNRLTSITAALPSIMNLSCASNTDLYCLPDITHNLIQLQINGTHITCLSTRFTATSYDVNPATMPLCGGTCDWDGRFVAIPDSNFGKWLYQNGYASSMRGNALTSFRLDTTSGAVQNADTMRCVNANIKNMTGLKYFTHLVYLDCSNNQLTDLSVVPATLKSMYCDSNQLRALPSILPLVTTLSCRYNPSLYCLPAFNAAQLNGFYIGNTNISCVVAPFTALAFDTDPSSLPICRSACITTGIYVDIPDSNFGRWLYNNGYDAQLIGVYGARRRLNILGTVQYATAIDCPSASITNLEGIQYFTSLSELDCTGNLLDSLPPLPSSLTSLICRENHLTGIAPLPAGLGLFWCNDNQLPQLPQLPASLTNFYCYNNLLDSLPLLPAGLSNFSCSYNRLRSLPALPSAVYDFFCSNNPLAAIPPLPRNLNSFSCDSTLITQLPALPPFLQNFYCRYNPQVVCLPYMTNSHLLNFRIDMSGITCVPNRFTATNYDWNPATMPICSPNSPCAPSYSHIITGNVHAYTANSCAADSLAPGHPMSNIKVLLKQNGQIVQQNYSNDLGQFAFATDSLQGYIVEIDTVMLPFQVTCPASASYSTYRPLTDTVADGLNFGLLCPGPDYGIRPIPGARFKPGDTTVVSVLAGNPLKLWYGADCGAGTAGAVMTSLSGPIHYAGPATGALTPVSVSGDTLLYNISDLDSLMPGDLYILVYTDTTALIGTPVCIAGHVTPAMPDAYPADDSYTECSAVVSAFDPNYKEAYPAMLSADPEWLTYTVHFQNTGNDTADRVVVKDTLSVDLDISSFQYLGASHKASVQLSGNVCTFTFAGIELPASTINNEASQGWLQYKIRTNAGLAQTALVRNTAYIYFDYNPAVATNTTTNSFITGIHQPSLNGNVHLYPNPNNGSFILETKGGKSSEYAVYDVVGRLMLKGHQESMTETIHMPDAADGIYTIVIRTGDSRETIRFVLSR